jgi:hypothetical protein
MKGSRAASSGAICRGSGAGLWACSRSGAPGEPMGRSSTACVPATISWVGSPVSAGRLTEDANAISRGALSVRSCRTTPSVMMTARTAATIVLSAVAITNSQGLMLGWRPGAGAVAGPRGRSSRSPR